MMKTQTCTKCKKSKGIEEFHFSVSRNRYHVRCKTCFGDPEKSKASSRRWRERNPGLAAARVREWVKNNPERHRQNGRNHVAKLKALCYAFYGPNCKCCGESESKFLTIDHMNNDGAEHRKEIRGDKIYGWLVRNGFPDGFQVLCWNCNLGKQMNHGVCPHQEEGSTTIPSGSRAQANGVRSTEAAQ